MADDAAKLQIVLEALVGEFKASLQQAVGVVQKSTQQMQGQVKTSTQQMESSFKSMGSNITGSMKDMHGQVTGAISGIGSTIGKLAGIMAGVGAVLAGGKFFKDFIQDSIDYVAHAKKLSEVMGVNINDAAGYILAYKRVGITHEQLENVLKRFQVQLRQNPELLKKYGVDMDEIRAKGGGLREAFEKSKDALRDMATGYDRNLAAQEVWGSRVDNVNKFLRVYGDDVASATKYLEGLGLVIGPEMEANVRLFKRGLVDVDTVMLALKMKVATEVLPELIRMGNWFTGEGKSAVSTFATVVSTLAKTFGALGTAVGWIYDALNVWEKWQKAASATQRIFADFGIGKYPTAGHLGVGSHGGDWGIPEGKPKEGKGKYDSSSGAGAGGGKSAKEEAQTEVTLMEQLAWGAEDAKKALALCDERLEKMRENSVRLLSGQEKYASTMAGLSPILSEQLKWKEIEIEKEIELKLASLDRELAEKKISQAIYDQEKGMIALTSQAKRYQLEMSRWETQGIGGGVKMLQMEMAKESGTQTAKDFVAGFKKAQDFAGDALSGFLKGALRGEKADLRKLGMSIADIFIDGIAKRFAGTMFNTVFGVMANAWASTQATMTAASAAGESARLGITASGASQGMGILASLAKGTILIQAGQAAAGAFKSVMQAVPFPLNVVLAPVVAAAAFAATLAFGSGFGSGGSAGTTNPSGGYSEGYHTGGIITAHGGLRLDERMVKAQVGEWILNRDAARELGRKGGPSTFDNLNSGVLPVSADGRGGPQVNQVINMGGQHISVRDLNLRVWRKFQRKAISSMKKDLQKIAMMG